MPLPVRLLAAVMLLAGVASAQPRVSFIHNPPAQGRPGEPLTLEGEVSGGELTALSVYVRGPSEDWERFELELQYGDYWRGTLPASRMVPPWVVYYVVATTRAGRSDVFGSANRPVRVDIGAQGTKLKCKRVKKGKKWVQRCVEAGDDPPPSVEPDDPAPAEPEPEPEPEREPEPRPAPKSEPRAAPEREPEPEPQPVQKAEPGPELRAAPPPRSEVKAAQAASPPASELEEELALYGAEAAGGVVQRVAESAGEVSSLAPSVLTAAELKRRGVRFVYEALELVPGVSVSRDMQGNWRVAMRGLRADPEVLFTLNGQRLNNFYDAKALANLPVDNLERIEIFRGPATADVGLGNVTGLINLVTRRDVGFRDSGSGGRGMSFDGHANGAFVAGPVKVFGDVDVSSQEGQQLTVLRDGDTTDTGAKRTTDRRFLLNASLGAELSLDQLGTFEASGRVLYEDRSALLGLFDVVGPDSRLQWLTGQAQLGWRKTLDAGQLSVRAWFDQQTTDRLWQQTPSSYTDGAISFPDGAQEQHRFGVRGFGVSGRGDFKLPFNNLLSAGVQLEHQSIFSAELRSNVDTATNGNLGALQAPVGLRLPTEDGAGGRGPAADRFTGSVFVTDTWTPLDVVSVHAGLRFDLVQLPGGVTPGFGPRIGVTVTPIKSLALRANYGRSFRAPSPREYAEALPANGFNAGRFIGNLSLQPAYLDAVEAGAEYVQGLGEGRLRLRGTFFFERMTNAVVEIDTTGNLTPFSNRLLGVQSIGLEGEARLELTQRLHVWLNASWVRAEDLSTPAQSRLLTDVPQLRANGGVTLPLGPWLNLDFVARFASERRNNTRSVLELIRRYTLPGYATFTAQLRTEPIFDHVELLLLGQNVFNFEYADDATRPDRVPGGVPRDGWSLFGQAKVSF